MYRKMCAVRGAFIHSGGRTALNYYIPKLPSSMRLSGRWHFFVCVFFSVRAFVHILCVIDLNTNSILFAHSAE